MAIGWMRTFFILIETGKTKLKKHSLKVFVLVLLHLSFAGCGKPDVAKNITAEKNKTNIQKLANSVVLYSALKQNRGPQSAEQLVDFVENNPNIERNLNWMGIERGKFSDYFTSSVDQQEFRVRWGLAINPEEPAVPLVFEQSGNNDGVRRVALSDGRVLEVENDTKYKELLAGRISKADAGAAAWQGGDKDADDE